MHSPPMGTPKPARQPTRRALGTAGMLSLLLTLLAACCARAARAGSPAGLQLPAVTTGAGITGLASAEAQAAFDAAERGWARGTRVLLHGRRPALLYSVCPTCTLVACSRDSGETRCSGHCKRRRQLFTYRTQGVSGGQCSDLDKPDPDTVPVDRLDPLRSVALEATAPYIGCAYIVGLPSGCPAAGTAGVRPDGTAYSVLWTQCEAFRYELQCVEGINRTPFHPFGYCKCVVSIDGGGLSVSACSLAELDSYSGPPLRESGGVPVEVFPDDNVTATRFGVRESVDFPIYRYNNTFDVGGEDVLVSMAIWYAPQSTGDNMTLEGPL
eukprot:jgi/Ulvmu1/6274/UM028_0134.1